MRYKYFIKVCSDKYVGCETWAGKGQCDTNPLYVLRYCPKACEVCEANSATGKTY